MSLWVKIENGVVTACQADTPSNQTDWRQAVEVRPTLDSAKQHYGAHSFDLSKDPVEIVWPVVDFTDAELQGQNASSAKIALDESDITMLRCLEANIPVPPEWNTYRDALRMAIKDGTQPIPTRPAYPAGT